MKRIELGVKSDVGRVRSENQDAMGNFPADRLDLTSSSEMLFVVADGLGGHAGGKKASRLAVETIGRTYFSSTASPHERLRQALAHANSTIYDYSLNNPKYFGMGTTCVALVLLRDTAYIAHVGDSRLYRITQQAITQVTQDHSEVAEMVRRGILTDEEARRHPRRSMLYRAIGTQDEVEIDLINGVAIGPDEYFLLCSDGLTGHVEDDELQKIVVSHPPQAACDMLVDLANQRGGSDNITVQIIHVKSEASFLQRVLRTETR